MENDVFDNYDRIVDDQPNRSGQTAERHQVEAFAEGADSDAGYGNGDGNDQAGDDGRSPIAQKEHENDGREDEADEDGVANTLDGSVDELRLIVERLNRYAGRKRLLQVRQSV